MCIPAEHAYPLSTLFSAVLGGQASLPCTAGGGTGASLGQFNLTGAGCWWFDL